eukprot:PhF_6_TR13894/c1_g1_i2/m.22325
MSLESLRIKYGTFRRTRGWEVTASPRSATLAIGCSLGRVAAALEPQPEDATQLSSLSLLERKEVEKEIGSIVLHVIGIADTLGINLSEAVLKKISKTANKYPAGSVQSNPLPQQQSQSQTDAIEQPQPPPPIPPPSTRPATTTTTTTTTLKPPTVRRTLSLQVLSERHDPERVREFYSPNHFQGSIFSPFCTDKDFTVEYPSGGEALGDDECQRASLPPALREDR